MTGIGSLDTAARLPADPQQTSRRARPGVPLIALSVGVLACWASGRRGAASQALTEDDIQKTRLARPAQLPRWQAQLAALPALPPGIKADLSVWGDSRNKGAAHAWDAYTIGGLSLCPCPSAPLEQRREFVAQVCTVAQQKETDEKHGLVLTDLGSGDLLQLTLQIEALLVTQPRLTVQIIERALPAIACGNFTVDAGTLSARAPQDRSCLDRKEPFGLARYSDVDNILPFLAALQLLTHQYGARIDIDAYQSAQTYVDAVLESTVPKSHIILMVDPGKVAPVPWPLANRVEGTDAQGSFTVHVPAEGGRPPSRSLHHDTARCVAF